MSKEIPLTEFIFRIGERVRAKSPPFCFILGAGASVQSGIPTGAQLAERWLREIYRMRTGQHPSNDQLALWLGTRPIEEIPSLTLANIPENYSTIFQVRFSGDSNIAEQTLNNLMEGREPSFGYSILARILALTPHNTVTTTNFDHLIASSLAIYQQTIGKMLWQGKGVPHGLNFIKDSPKILKVHGEAGFNTKNSEHELAVLEAGWEGMLNPLFETHIPIVIGYGGNDKGFMDFLARGKHPSKQGLYWCYRSADGQPPSSERIQRVLEAFNGVFVAVPDFDEAMLLLGDTFDISPIEHDIRKRQENQLAAWRRSFEDVADNLRKFLPIGRDVDPEAFHDVARKAVEKMLPPPVGREWWEWHASARNAGNSKEAENEYELGLRWIPHSAPLMACYAHFLSKNDPKSEKIEPLVKRAKEIIAEQNTQSPEVLSVLHQLGRISQVSGNLNETIEYFEKVLAGRRVMLGSEHPDTQASIQNLAEVFLELEEFEKAEALYTEFNGHLRSRYGEDHPYFKLDSQRLAGIRLRIRESRGRGSKSGTPNLLPARKRVKKRKRIVIHQPHFLPWLGYFNKLVNCSHFVVLDNVNFRERYYQNRTRIRNTDFGFTWLTLPTHATLHDFLFDATISEPDWKKHVSENLRHVYRRGRYFDETWSSFSNWLQPLGSELVDVNVNLIRSVLKHLMHEQIGISLGRDHEGEYLELLELFSLSERTNELRRTLKVAAICRSVGANELIMGEGGGRECHNLDLLRRFGVQIIQQRFLNGFSGYRDIGKQNIEGVSIMDALFLIGRQETVEILRKSWSPAHSG